MENSQDASIRSVQRCSVKKVFLKILQENTSARVSFLIKNTFFHRTPPVAASEVFLANLISNFHDTIINFHKLICSFRN